MNKKHLKRILKILHKSNEKAWRNMAIRGMADFNKYAEHLESERCEKLAWWIEKIIKGVVSNIEDGSIDELLSAEKIIVNGQIRKGPDAKSVVVIETKTVDIPLKKRVKAHSYILKSSRGIYALAKDIFDES